MQSWTRATLELSKQPFTLPAMLSDLIDMYDRATVR